MTPKPNQKKAYTLDAKGNMLRWGLTFPPNTTPLTMELFAFKRHLDKPKGKPLPDSAGAAWHFWRIADHLWPYDPKSKRGFCRHPWAERMTDAACEHSILGISGPHSCGKSDWGAVWGIVNFIADPINTLVLATSTDIASSRKRIWGKIEKYWRSVSIGVGAMPGKLTRQPPMIRYTGQNSQGDVSSMSLIPSSPQYAQETSDKLIGLKNKRVILIGDEMTDISPAVVASIWNLQSNPYFYFVGFANFASLLDPFGSFTTPKLGWGSVHVTDTEWETERGYCLHIDGHEAYDINPTGEYPILSGENLDRDTTPNKERDPGYWRFVRSFPIPSGTSTGVFCEADMVKYGGFESVTWLGVPNAVVGCDPSFAATNNADRCIAQLSYYGLDADRRPVILIAERKELTVDVTDPEPPNGQRVKQLVAFMESYDVAPENVAVDATGGGALFCEMLADELGTGNFMRVIFNATATDSPVSTHNAKPGNEVYADRAAELWYTARRFLENDQLKGIDKPLARELCARKIKEDSKKFALESKRDMKRVNHGCSPDLADAAVLSVAVCVEKLGAIPGGADAQTPEQRKAESAKQAKTDIHTMAKRAVRIIDRQSESFYLEESPDGAGWGTFI